MKKLRVIMFVSAIALMAAMMTGCPTTEEDANSGGNNNGGGDNNVAEMSAEEILAAAVNATASDVNTYAFDMDVSMVMTGETPGTVTLNSTGISNKRVLENFVKLHQSGMKLIVESVFIPDYIDTNEIERIAKFISGADKDIPFILLPYFKSGDNPWRRPNPEEMEKAASIAKKHLKNVYHFRGDEELEFEVVSVFPNGAVPSAKSSQEELRKSLVPR